ncbi:hypothetical protein [Desulfolithobacter sp.]
MKSVFSPLAVVLAALVLVLSGCGAPKNVSTGGDTLIANYPVRCITVLPVRNPLNPDEDISPEAAAAMARGIPVLDRLLQEQLAGRGDVRFVSGRQLAGLGEELTPGGQGLVREAGKRFGCNAVLEVVLERYKERIGGEYAVEQPASVAFSYRLIGVDSGVVLCRGTVDEAQQSVAENIFAFGKARKRGFTWVTAEELLREGLQEKFSGCSYLVPGSR